MTVWNQLFYKSFSFGVGVMHNEPSNKPTNIANSVDETATAG